MERGLFLSKKDLEELGWSYVSFFADCEIWSKENNRILWRNKSQEVIFIYTYRK